MYMSRESLGQIRERYQKSCDHSQNRRGNNRPSWKAKTALVMAVIGAIVIGITSQSSSPPRLAYANKTDKNLTIRSSDNNFVLSERAAEKIAYFEGFFARAYNDPVGHCTIGYGTLIHLGNCTESDYLRWGKITRARGQELLRKETSENSAAINKMVKVPLNQSQHDALVSFTYNCGIYALSGSTLLKLLNRGLYKRAANQFPLFNHAGGVVLEGLTKRRLFEKYLFLSPPLT